MYAVHPRLIGKLIVDFLLVIIELFFARCFRFVKIYAFDGRTDGRLYDRQYRVAYNIAVAYFGPYLHRNNLVSIRWAIKFFQLHAYWKSVYFCLHSAINLRID